jgi:hypothetical protein
MEEKFTSSPVLFVKNFSFVSRKNIIILTLLIFASVNLRAQKKLSFDLSAAVLQSVGKDISKTYNSNVNPLTLQHFSRKQFKHPYFNILGHVSYSLNKRVSVGVESGLYMHYLEKYFSNIQRTSLSIPIMGTVCYKLFKIKEDEVGISAVAGKVFYNIDDIQFKIKNGALYNASAFYDINKKSTIKLGVEKQVDNVWFYFTADEQGYQNETYKYHLNRLSLILAYSFKLGK